MGVRAVKRKNAAPLPRLTVFSTALLDKFMSNPGGIRKEKNRTVSALCGAAAVQCLLGFVGWSMNGRSFGWLDWAFSFSGVICLGLALATRRHRLSAALTGAGLYAGLLALQLLHGVAALKSGLVFKIPVVLFLLVAVVLALRRRGVAPPRP